ncbi:MAG: 2-amino-3,7-dideoxy-D-threo-hept-6-ulosonate synthase [Firmicutes bacterium]|nr:2-amino-3,7-dideoxy-D-threo-hept-6-ulosonate synthase [Bacillota bacterium]MDI6706064.1 fructose-bisphosphate aldolase [Bacillota bacterium]
MTGKMNRMARIFKNDTGKSLLVALDHGMALGPMRGIEDINETMEGLLPWTDCVMMTKGMLQHCYRPDGKRGIIMRLSGGATIAGEDLRNEQIISTPEEALYMGADAVAVGVSIGSPFEAATLTGMAIKAAECRKWNLPVLGIVTVGKDKEKRFDPDFLRLSARVLAEHGADIVKTYYTHERFEEVVKGCPAPILIAGGPKCETELDVLEMVYGAIHSGAAGIAMGRNLWQSSNPIGMIQAVYNIIHENATVEQVKSFIL